MNPLERIQLGSQWQPGTGQTPQPPRIKTLAGFITKMWPDLLVTLEPWTSNTDRKVGRLRIQGKGVQGQRLTVKKDIDLLFSHTTSEAYRHNGEVCRWIVDRIEELEGPLEPPKEPKPRGVSPKAQKNKVVQAPTQGTAKPFDSAYPKFDVPPTRDEESLARKRASWWYHEGTCPITRMNNKLGKPRRSKQCVGRDCRRKCEQHWKNWVH